MSTFFTPTLWRKMHGKFKEKCLIEDGKNTQLVTLVYRKKDRQSATVIDFPFILKLCRVISIYHGLRVKIIDATDNNRFAREKALRDWFSTCYSGLASFIWPKITKNSGLQTYLIKIIKVCNYFVTKRWSNRTSSGGKDILPHAGENKRAD